MQRWWVQLQQDVITTTSLPSRMISWKHSISPIQFRIAIGCYHVINIPRVWISLSSNLHNTLQLIREPDAAWIRDLAATSATFEKHKRYEMTNISHAYGIYRIDIKLHVYDSEAVAVESQCMLREFSTSRWRCYNHGCKWACRWAD
jgi:hypothetical protein